MRLVASPGAANLKVTTPADAILAEALLRGARAGDCSVSARRADRLPHAPPARRRGGAASAQARGRGRPRAGTSRHGWIGRYVDRARARAVAEIAITEHVYRFAEARDWLDDPLWREEATEDVDAYCDGDPRRPGGGPAGAAGRRDGLAARPHRARSPRSSRGGPSTSCWGRSTSSAARAIDDPGADDRGGRPPAEVWAGYLDELVAAAGSGLYDVMSHPDLPKVFGRRIPPALEPAARRRGRTRSPTPGWPSSARRPACASRSASSTRSRGCWPGSAQAGVPVDALERRPRAARTWRATTPTAVAALRGAGYETITRFSLREPPQVPLRWDMRVGSGVDAHRFGPGAAADARHDRGGPRRGPGGPLGRRRRGPRGLRRAAGGGRASRTSARCSRPARPEWEGVSGARMLEVVRDARPRAGFAPVNAHAVVVCERPRVAPHRAAMEAALTGHPRRARHGPRHHHRRPRRARPRRGDRLPRRSRCWRPRERRDGRRAALDAHQAQGAARAGPRRHGRASTSAARRSTGASTSATPGRSSSSRC